MQDSDVHAFQPQSVTGSHCFEERKSKKKKKKELELKQLIPSGARNEQMEQEGKG